MERVYRRSEKENKTIGIRADGNAKLGMGHLMRCLSIAQALKQSGMFPVFITADDSAAPLIERKGLRHEILGSDYARMESECEALRKIIEGQKISLLLVDSYQVTPEYLQTVRKWVKVVCLEEEIREGFYADGVINYNIYAEELPYDSCYPKTAYRYLGSKFAPVRPEFARNPIPIRERVRKILITMGGSDMPGISLQLLKRCLSRREQEEAEFEVVCGAFNPHREELEKLSEENSRVHIQVQAEDMAGLMAQCDLAVSAAGSTMYELAALGIPTVCCYYVDNQKKIAEGFARFTKTVNAGDYREEPEKVLDDILTALKELASDKELRKETAESMRVVSDGRGAVRLAQKLQQDFFPDGRERPE